MCFLVSNSTNGQIVKPSRGLMGCFLLKEEWIVLSFFLVLRIKPHKKRTNAIRP